MRGKLKAERGERKTRRITPAHAGKTWRRFSRGSTTTDHPRACGENLFVEKPLEEGIGSPPRMRGKQRLGLRSVQERRITPAHAGKTVIFYGDTETVTDHPRACGENVTEVGKVVWDVGSPPRMRGKLSGQEKVDFRPRITPAHAGKTRRQRPPLPSRTDHPRACGENNGARVDGSIPVGSPPRMRGKLDRLENLDHKRRITPAHAGKTLRKWRISVVDPSPQPQSSLTSRRADASIGSQRAPCAAPV